MVDYGTILAVVALLTGVGGMVVAFRKVGPERTNVIVTYQAAVLDDLRTENERLVRINRELEKRVDCLEEEVELERRRRAEVERRLRHLEELGARFERQERERPSSGGD